MLKVENTQLGEQAISTVRRIVLLVIVPLALALFVANAIAGKREVRIGYYVIDPSGFQDKMQFLIAEIANDTLSQHLERQFDQEAGTYAYVDRLYDLPEVDRQNSSDLSAVLASQENLLVKHDYDLVVVASLSVQELGYLVRVTSIDLRPGRGKIDWRGTPSLAVLEPTGNFVNVEKEMEVIARRIALRFTDINTRPAAQARAVTPVLFWCIQSANPEDLELSQISRRLTLELPFFLAEQRHDATEQYDFTGMSARDYIGECLEGSYRGAVPLRSYLDFQRYTYVVSGVADINRNITGDPIVNVKYLFDWRTEGYGIPKTVTGISPKLDKESLRKDARNFLRDFSAAVRKELIRSAQSNLLSLGFYKARVDGVFGPDTKEAIKAFQQDFSLEITGTITPGIVDILHRRANPLK